MLVLLRPQVTHERAFVLDAASVRHMLNDHWPREKLFDPVSDLGFYVFCRLSFSRGTAISVTMALATGT